MPVENENYIHNLNLTALSSADMVAQLVRAPFCVWDAQTARDRASAALIFTFLLFFFAQKLSFTIGTMFRQ